MHFVFASMLALIGTTSAWAEEPDSLTLEQAEMLAIQHNPGLIAQAANVRALAQIPVQVGSLPDPALSLKALNLPTGSFSFSQENMTQLQLGLSQTLPFPGKLGLQEREARLQVQTAEFDEAEFQLMLTRDVRISWWNLFYINRALSIVRRNQELLRQFVKIAETKYKVGKGLQQDVLLAQLELSKLLDAEISLDAAMKRETAVLNRLLNQPVNTPLQLPAQVNEALPEVESELALAHIAQSSRPLLARYTKQIEVAETRIDLAEKHWFPDFNLGAAYGIRTGTDPMSGQSRSDLVSATLSLNLPIYSGSKQSRMVDQRQAELVRSEFELADAKMGVLAEVSQALADYLQARNQAQLFKTGIIPQANQTVASMLAGYQVNKVDFLNLVRAQVTLYNFETQYWQAIASANQSIARLAAAVGKEISNE